MNKGSHIKNEGGSLFRTSHPYPTLTNTIMRKTILLLLSVVAMLLTGCNQQSPLTKPAPVETRAEGDSTLYGLVCDGSNDTLLIFLRTPYQGDDPDTLYILNAIRRGEVFGQPRVGDQLAIMRNDTDSTSARRIIVTEDLQGQWRFQAHPTLRRHVSFLADSMSVPTDSLRRLLNTVREFGYDIKDENVMRPFDGGHRDLSKEDNSPIEWPKLKRYREWHIYNGRLILSANDTLRNIQLSDTADFVLLRPDSLVLRFADGIKSYYRKIEAPTQ